MSLITTTEDLARFCAAHAAVDYVTVDTEFMRERTYYPKLCLIQLGGPEEVVAVDPLAKGISLEPLFELLANPKVVKVFHAARQDVEIFVNLTGKVPAPLFDTQVAAMVCGFGDSASYETLAGQLAGARIDKSSRFTDWAHRPLTEKQIDYALGDVSHLRVVYEKLREKLQRTGRGEWLDEEMAVLTAVDTYRADPAEIWRKFKWRADKPKLRALLRELAAWREREAQRADVPRQRIVKDETLMEIAHHAPVTVQELTRMRGLNNGFAESRNGSEVLAAVQRALSLPPDQYPEGDGRRLVPGNIGPVMDLLKVLLKQVADAEGVAAKLIATTDELEALAIDDNADVPALHGWRRQLFGEQALALKHGKLGLSVKDRRVLVTQLNT